MKAICAEDKGAALAQVYALKLANLDTSDLQIAVEIQCQFNAAIELLRQYREGHTAEARLDVCIKDEFGDTTCPTCRGTDDLLAAFNHSTIY